MNKLFTFLFAILFAIPCFATGVTATNGVANDATCDTNVLGSDSGSVELTPTWSANNIGLKWTVPQNEGISGGTGGATSCTYGQTINLPSNPTKRGYIFKGWRPIQRIEYLQSDGNQYIDTGILFNSGNIKINASVYVDQVDAGKEYDFFGNIEGFSNVQPKGFCCGVWDKNKIFLYGYPDSNPFNKTISQAGWYTIDIESSGESANKNISFWVNGELVGADSRNMYSTNNITIFKGGPTYVFKMNLDQKFKTLVIYINNTKVRDMIPVKDTNGVACMYDKVTGQFFYNQGTGNFVAGPEI